MIWLLHYRTCHALSYTYIFQSYRPQLSYILDWASLDSLVSQYSLDEIRRKCQPCKTVTQYMGRPIYILTNVFLRYLQKQQRYNQELQQKQNSIAFYLIPGMRKSVQQFSRNASKRKSGTLLEINISVYIVSLIHSVVLYSQGIPKQLL